jgi:hypothetical protein
MRSRAFPNCGRGRRRAFGRHASRFWSSAIALSTRRRILREYGSQVRRRPADGRRLTTTVRSAQPPRNRTISIAPRSLALTRTPTESGSSAPSRSRAMA